MHTKFEGVWVSIAAAVASRVRLICAQAKTVCDSEMGMYTDLALSEEVFVALDLLLGQVV